MNTYSNSLRPEPEVLLAQTEWVRRLAVHLVGDATRADDLAQETLLAAWSHPEALLGADVTRVRSWLARVLRNRVFSEFRGRARQREREQAVARSERVPGAGELVERASMHGAVVAAVLRLEEPHRELLLMRYFEGRSNGAIAGELGISLVACRKRVSRALGLLRGELESEFGADGAEGGGAWGVLVALAGPARWGHTLGTARALSKGASGVASWLIGGAALVLALLGAMMFFGTEAGTTREVGARLDPELVAPAARVAMGLAPAVAGAPANARGAVPSSPELVIRLVVRSKGSGEPVKGVRVCAAVPRSAHELEAKVAGELARLGIAEESEDWLALAGEERIPGDPATLDQLPYQARPGSELGVTGSDGTLGLFELPSGGQGLVLEAAGFAPMLVLRTQLDGLVLAQSAAAVPQLEVGLRPLQDQLVLVEDRFGGPVEGAFVRVELAFGAYPAGAPRPALDGLAWRGPTDPLGRLIVRGLPGATPLAFTALGDFVDNSYLGGGVVAGEEPVVLSVIRVGQLTGRLVDAGGEPMPDAVVSLWNLRSANGRWTNGMQTDADGRFFFAAARTGPARLKLAQIELRTIEVLPNVLNDLGDIALERLEPVTGELRLRASGEPLPFVNLGVYRDGEFLQACRSDDVGHFALELAPGRYGVIVYLASGDRLGDPCVVELEVPSGDYDLIVDAALGGLRLSLPEGMPAETSVRVRLSTDPESGRLPGDAPVGGAPGLNALEGFFECRSEAGFVVLHGLPVGRFDIEVAAGEFGMQLFPGMEIVKGEVLDLGRLNLSGAELFGRVLDSKGQPAVGAEVTIVAIPLRANPGLSAVWRRVETDRDGRYRLSLIDSRAWHVYANWNLTEVSSFTRIEPAPEAEFELNFQLEPAAWIEGRVLEAGQPVAGFSVQQFFGELDQMRLSLGAPDQVLSDSEGHYRLGPLFPGRNHIAVRGHTGWRLIELELGETRELDFELELGTAEQVRVAIDFGEAPFREVLGIWAGSWGGSGRTSLPGIVGHPLGGAEASVPAVERPLLLFVRPEGKLWSGGSGIPVQFVIPIAAGALREGATLSLPPGIVEVASDPRAADAPAAELFFRSIPGQAFDFKIPTRLPPARVEGGVRFYGIPAGAELTLEGHNAEGRRFKHRFTYTGPGVMHIEPHY